MQTSLSDKNIAAYSQIVAVEIQIVRDGIGKYGFYICVACPFLVAGALSFKISQ